MAFKFFHRLITSFEDTTHNFEQLEQLFAAPGVLVSPLSTALPVTPADGQEFTFIADATNGVVWRFRYRAASGSAYKWEFVGGPPLYAQVVTNESTTSQSATTLTTAGPSITLPTLSSGGDFDVQIGALVTVTGQNAGDLAYMSYAIGGTGAAVNDAVSSSNPVASKNAGSSVARTQRKTGLASGTVLAARYWGNSNGTVTSFFANRFMSVTPVRVG